ncbi:MAG: hypothetical protein DRH30_01765 [Deltaproteobacteria bacterium]|nr:MAG: hypothetical protein DRH30_01765 [Deltaproteobacteria bacterium]
MARVNVRIEIIRGMAGETVARNRRPLPFSVALMALGTIGERVHPGQWEARPAMNFERLHVVPSSRRVATAAAPTQARLMRIAVTVAALPGHALLAAMTLIAGRGIVSSAERETGSRVIEALSRLTRGHAPARRGVTVPAIHSLGDRVVPCGLGTTFLSAGILSHGDRRHPSKAGDAQHDGDRAVHRFPFLRAWGLP